MVLASSHGEGVPPPRAPGRAPSVIWHDLELGSYRADLPLWLELAERARSQWPGAPILEIGAGTGRVALALARDGHRVSALDHDPELLGALSARAEAMRLQTICADARTFELARRDFALCLAPMQTVQLLGGSAGRSAFLRRARAHLRPGAVLACAIVTELEPFDCAAGDPAPTPETTRVDRHLYLSRPTGVRVHGASIRVERERCVVPAKGHGADASPVSEHDVVELDRLSARRLRREGLDAGFSAAGTRSIASTAEHLGSVVVILRA